MQVDRTPTDPLFPRAPTLPGSPCFIFCSPTEIEYRRFSRVDAPRNGLRMIAAHPVTYLSCLSISNTSLRVPFWRDAACSMANRHDIKVGYSPYFSGEGMHRLRSFAAIVVVCLFASLFITAQEDTSAKQ